MVILAASLFALSASGAESVIAAAGLQSDVRILEAEYRELHPGLLRYLTPEDLDRGFAHLRQEFSHPRTLAETYLALARFPASIKCGHTYANFFNQTRVVQKSLFESTPRLPFYFQWIDGQMIVTRDFSRSNALPRGSEVVRINNHPAAIILKRLLPLARADGSNDAKRIAQLAVTGDSKYEPFDVYFPLLFPVASKQWDLQVRLPHSRVLRRVVVDAISFAQRIEPIAANEDNRHGGDEPVFTWRYLSDGTAYLRMPAWDLYQSKWEWREWLNAHLDELVTRGAKALIIDLRGNEGGNDVGDEILPRLIVGDLPLSGMKRLVRYRSVPPGLLPHLSTWDPSFKDWGTDARTLNSRWPTAPLVDYYGLAGADSSENARAVLHPRPPYFAGRVFVIVDASNSSATFQFEQVIQENHLGRLVGQPTGGNLRGINGGAFFFLTLPNSGIELDLPLIGTFPSTSAPDAGLVPDVLVHTSAADIAASRDREMAVVTGMIASSR